MDGSLFGLLRGASAACEILLLGTVLAGFAPAATIDVNLGVFSFDVLDPASGQFAGINQFTIYNFTGANNLPPDFAAATDVLFQNPTVDLGTGPINIDGIDSNSGGIQPALLMFLSTEDFISATFGATVSTTNIQLADGISVHLSGNQVSGSILPSQGNSLTAGVDFALLTVTGTVAETMVPEPRTSGTGFVALLFLIAAGVISKSRYRAPKESFEATEVLQTLKGSGSSHVGS